MAAKSGDSARARLIKTRRRTWIDESLIPAARRECLEILRITSQAVGEGMAKRVRNVGQHMEEDSSRSDLFAPNGYRARVSDELEALHTEFLKYRLPEEARASEVAYEAIQGVRTCGFCGRDLSLKEAAYLGAKVYVGMWPLAWDYSRKPQVGKPLYVDTVLCSSCAPEWLSPERDEIVMQLCAHCERPMVSPLDLSALGAHSVLIAAKRHIMISYARRRKLKPARRSARSAARSSPRPGGTPRLAPSGANRRHTGNGRRRRNRTGRLIY
jgi:hypothetical protein